MNKYLLRLNYTGITSDGTTNTRGKVAFKTKETNWLKTKLPCIALISVESSFHYGVNGDLKMGAFLSTIQKNTMGTVSILFADTAHFHTQKLVHQKNALDVCIQSSSILSKRYAPHFANSKTFNWNSFICQDTIFFSSLEKIEELFHTDKYFQDLLLLDAISTYTPKRAETFPEKERYIEKTISDLLCQCASLLVLSRKGYRFQFYPGAPYASTEYINLLLPDERRVNWINVFLSIEKKTVLPSSSSCCSSL